MSAEAEAEADSVLLVPVTQALTLVLLLCCELGGWEVFSVG